MKWTEEKGFDEGGLAAFTARATQSAYSSRPPRGINEEFFEKVYEQVARVPAGFVCTYGTIAKLAGYPKAAREVGYAMSQVTPQQGLAAHRIVNAKGTLAPASVFGGEDRQREMLEDEGVLFLSDGRIDMKRCSWPPVDDEGDGEQLPLF